MLELDNSLDLSGRARRRDPIDTKIRDCTPKLVENVSGDSLHAIPQRSAGTLDAEYARRRQPPAAQALSLVGIERVGSSRTSRGRQLVR